MQTGDGYYGGRFAGQQPAQPLEGTTAAVALGVFFLVAVLFQWWETGASAGAGWVNLCALEWGWLRGGGEWWRLFTYCAVHHSLWHGIAGAIGLYAAGKAVEPIIGTSQVFCAALLGTAAGAAASCG